jgi:GrpB-like predicted nucleotidyltransferase (UPF0157 family)
MARYTAAIFTILVCSNRPCIRPIPEPIVYTSNREYELVPFDPTWPEWYQKEAALLSSIFGDKLLSIQHVGSTSIPGMSGKPQLDILATMQNVEDADAFGEKLAEHNYKAYGDVLKKGGRLFSRWDGDAKTANFHIYEPGSPAIQEYLVVRNYMIAHPEVAQEYADLKLELVKKYPSDYLKYREYKDPRLNALKRRIGEES